MFANMLGYKLHERGHKLEKIPAPYTSQACPECGVIGAASRITRAQFVCMACGFAEHADVVGARNIDQARILAVEPPKRTLRRVGKRKQLKEVAHATT